MSKSHVNATHAEQTAEFSTYTEFYGKVHCGAFVEHHPNPAGGTVFVSAQSAGDWSDPRIPELAIGSITSGSGTYHADLGAGKFRSRIMPRETILVAPGAGSEIVRDSPHTVLVLTIPYLKLVELARDDCSLPANADFGELHARPIGDPLIPLVLRRVWAALRAPAPRDRLFHEGALLMLVGALTRLRPDNAKRSRSGGLAPLQLKHAQTFIDHHLAEDLSLKVIADEAGLSPFYFSRAFRKSTGLPPHRFLLQRRIERACHLLQANQGSITEIASAIGFSDASYFARIFKRVIGVTPKEYRQLQRRTRASDRGRV